MTGPRDANARSDPGASAKPKEQQSGKRTPARARRQAYAVVIVGCGRTFAIYKRLISAYVAVGVLRRVGYAVTVRRIEVDQ